LHKLLNQSYATGKWNEIRKEGERVDKGRRGGSEKRGQRDETADFESWIGLNTAPCLADWQVLKIAKQGMCSYSKVYKSPRSYPYSLVIVYTREKAT